MKSHPSIVSFPIWGLVKGVFWVGLFLSLEQKFQISKSSGGSFQPPYKELIYPVIRTSFLTPIISRHSIPRNVNDGLLIYKYKRI
jgi:hypothetical protein